MTAAVPLRLQFRELSRSSRNFRIPARTLACVFWIIIALDALRNSLGFVSNGFPRRLHFSKIAFRSEIVHFAWINLAIADLKLSVAANASVLF